MEQSREVRIVIANAIIDNLWAKGLLTDEERMKVRRLNEINIK